jgi:hypothetical protein
LGEVLRKDYGDNFKRVVRSVENNEINALGHKKINEHGFFYNAAVWMRTIEDPWRPNLVATYVELADQVDFASVSAVIRDSKLKHVNAHLAAKKPAVFLFPMSRWHVYSEFKDGRR